MARVLAEAMYGDTAYATITSDIVTSDITTLGSITSDATIFGAITSGINGEIAKMDIPVATAHSNFSDGFRSY